MGARQIRAMAAALVASAVLLTVAACAAPGSGGPTGGGPGPSADPSTSAAPAVPGTTQTRTVSVGGSDREYALHVPGTPDASPDLVVVLHWWGGSMDEQATAHGWADASDERGFLVAFGSGVDHSWNAGDCCGTAKDRQIDDVAYIDAVIDAVRAEHDIGRVVVAGTSNGAMMALRFGCESSTDADIAAVSGSLFVDCDGAEPRNVIMINGLVDETVRFDGAPGSSGIDGMPVADAFATWRGIDGCGDPQRTDSADGLVHTDAADCADGRRAELVTIEDAGHQWPYNRYDATDWIVDFLALGA